MSSWQPVLCVPGATLSSSRLWSSQTSALPQMPGLTLRLPPVSLRAITNNVMDRFKEPVRTGKLPFAASQPFIPLPGHLQFFFRSHVMKTFEWLLLQLLIPLVHHAQDLLLIASHVKVGLEDTLVYLLHWAHSHLDKGRVLVLLHWQTKKHFSSPGH